MLLVFLPLSGCRTAPPPVVTNNLDNLDDLVRVAAQEAIEQAAKAKNAQNQVNQLSDGNELRTLLNQANEAATAADEAASRAKSLQSQIDDLAARNQVADDVLQAQKAAEEARTAEAIIRLHLFPYQKNIDEISGIIIQQSGVEQSGKDMNVVKKIVNATLCDVFVKVASNQSLTEDDIERTLLIKSLGEEDISEFIDTLSDEISLAVSFLNQQTTDDQEAYKEACEALLEIQ
jgi:hypothetical protein